MFKVYSLYIVKKKIYIYIVVTSYVYDIEIKGNIIA